MTIGQYLTGVTYEGIMRIVYNCDQNLRNGADSSVYHLLAHYENDYSNCRESFVQQFRKLKTYLMSAFKQGRHRALKEDQIKSFTKLLDKLAAADTVKNIDEIITESFDLVADVYDR